MSRTETHVGKLIRTNETLESLAEGVEIPSYYQSLKDWFEDTFNGEKVIHDGVIYNVETKEVVGIGIYNAEPIEEGFNITLQFYNGGMCFSEAVEEALNKIK